MDLFSHKIVCKTQSCQLMSTQQVHDKVFADFLQNCNFWQWTINLKQFVRITQFHHFSYNVNSQQRFQSLSQLLGHHLIHSIMLPQNKHNLGCGIACHMAEMPAKWPSEWNIWQMYTFCIVIKIRKLSNYEVENCFEFIVSNWIQSNYIVL